MPTYSVILANQRPDKPFANFLHWLIEKNFYKEQTEKITIKKIAADFNCDSAKVTKWIKEIYDEIFELNFDRPELFMGDGVNLSLYIRYYDNGCTFYTSFPVIPREFETIKFPFVKGILGIDHFWVKKIEHQIEENNATVTLWLEGGTLNKYREFALDKALFQGWINFMDIFNNHSFEIDEELKNIYRN